MSFIKAKEVELDAYFGISQSYSYYLIMAIGQSKM